LNKAGIFFVVIIVGRNLLACMALASSIGVLDTTTFLGLIPRIMLVPSVKHSQTYLNISLSHAVNDGSLYDPVFRQEYVHQPRLPKRRRHEATSSHCTYYHYVQTRKRIQYDKVKMGFEEYFPTIPRLTIPLDIYAHSTFQPTNSCSTTTISRSYS
jgi:hypothetical protein